MRRRPPRSTPLYSSAASDVYKRQSQGRPSPSTEAGRPADVARPQKHSHAACDASRSIRVSPATDSIAVGNEPTVSGRIAPKRITVVADPRVKIVRLPTMSSPIAADLQFRVDDHVIPQG